MGVLHGKRIGFLADLRAVLIGVAGRAVMIAADQRVALLTVDAGPVALPVASPDGGMFSYCTFGLMNFRQ